MDKDNRVFSLKSTEDLQDIKGAGCGAFLLIIIMLVVIFILAKTKAPNLIYDISQLVFDFMDWFANVFSP